MEKIWSEINRIAQWMVDRVGQSVHNGVDGYLVFEVFDGVIEALIPLPINSEPGYVNCLLCWAPNRHALMEGEGVTVHPNVFWAQEGTPRPGVPTVSGISPDYFVSWLERLWKEVEKEYGSII